MKKMLALAVGLALSCVATAYAQDISANGSRPSSKGDPKYFTGSVIVDPFFGANANTPYSGGSVTFEPSARSAWHTHPAGQMLIVTVGKGWVQEEGREKREIKAGDVIWTATGVKHWHGASATTSMTHIALTNMKDDKTVDWLEKVTDQQYAK